MSVEMLFQAPQTPAPKIESSEASYFSPLSIPPESKLKEVTKKAGSGILTGVKFVRQFVIFTQLGGKSSGLTWDQYEQVILTASRFAVTKAGKFTTNQPTITPEYVGFNLGRPEGNHV